MNWNTEKIFMKIEKIGFYDQAVLPPALEESFAQFVHVQHQSNENGTEMPPRRSGGHRLVLLFTDGVEFWPTDVVQRFQQRQKAQDLPPIRVFGHSIGHGRGAQPALGWLICQTGAGLSQAQIGSVAEVRLKARAYLAKLSEVLALAYRDSFAQRRPISWSTPYMDVQKGGAVVSLSMPVLGPQSAIYDDLKLSQNKLADGNLRAKLDGFIAVAGLDIALAELARVMKLDDGEDGTLAYAFLVDNNGIVYFHPRLNTRAAGVFAVRQTMCHRISATLLRSNTRVPFTKADELVQQQMGYVDSVPHRDLLELEPDTPLMRRFRTRLVQRQCGVSMAPLEDSQRQLRCAQLKDTPLMLGFVLIKQRSRVSKTSRQFQDEDQEYEVDPFDLAERFRVAGFEAAVEQQKGNQENDEATTIGPPQFTNENDNNSFAQHSVGILLSPGPIKQWELSSALSSVRPLSRFRALVRRVPSLRRADPLLAHLSALAPDSVFTSWASAWSSSASPSSGNRFSASDCAQRPLPPRIDPRVFRSAFLQFRAVSLRDKAALTTFFPRCEFESVHDFIQRTNLRQSLAVNDVDNDANWGWSNDEKLRVEVDVATDDANKLTLNVHKFMAVVDKSIPLVQIGVQLRAHFFQQKFERALQQNQNGGWKECTNKAGRKCLLLSDSSMLLASSDPTRSASAVVHLSNSEPELFAELLSRGFIHKVVWRDNEAQCPMVVTLDQRQLQRHQYLQQLHAAIVTLSDSSSATPAAASMLSLSTVRTPFCQIVSLICAGLQWFGSMFSCCCCWLLLPAVGIAAIDNDATQHQHNHRHHGQPEQQQQFAALSSSDCQFDADQPTELLEQCTVEHTQYQLRVNTRQQRRNDDVQNDGGRGDGGIRSDGQSAVWMRDGCNRSIGLLPFVRSHLFLLLIDGICDKAAEKTTSSTAAKEAPQLRNKVDHKVGTTSADQQPMFPQFMSKKQVPNCELARASLALERTLRPDLDYTLSHLKEFNPICSLNSASQRQQTYFSPYFSLLFPFAIPSVLIYLDAFRFITF